MWKYKGQSPLLNVRQLCRPAPLQSSPRVWLRSLWQPDHPLLHPLLPLPSPPITALQVFPRALSLKIPICWSQSHSPFCRKPTQDKWEIKEDFVGDSEFIKLARVKIQLRLIVWDTKLEEKVCGEALECQATVLGVYLTVTRSVNMKPLGSQQFLHPIPGVCSLPHRIPADSRILL